MASQQPLIPPPFPLSHREPPYPDVNVMIFYSCGDESSTYMAPSRMPLIIDQKTNSPKLILKQVVLKLVWASPELFAPNSEFSVYAANYAASSRFGGKNGSLMMEGKGFLSWILGEDGLGRTTVSGQLRKGDQQPGGEETSVVVYVQLRSVPRMQLGDFLSLYNRFERFDYRPPLPGTLAPPGPGPVPPPGVDMNPTAAAYPSPSGNFLPSGRPDILPYTDKGGSAPPNVTKDLLATFSSSPTGAFNINGRDKGPHHGRGDAWSGRGFHHGRSESMDDKGRYFQGRDDEKMVVGDSSSPPAQRNMNTLKRSNSFHTIEPMPAKRPAISPRQGGDIKMDQEFSSSGESASDSEYDRDRTIGRHERGGVRMDKSPRNFNVRGPNHPQHRAQKSPMINMNGNIVITPATMSEITEEGGSGSSGNGEDEPQFSPSACQRCHGKHAKCDRTLPSCNRCVRGNHKCFYPAPHPRGPAYTKSLEEKLRYMESVLGDGKPGGRRSGAQMRGSPFSGPHEMTPPFMSDYGDYRENQRDREREIRDDERDRDVNMVDGERMDRSDRDRSEIDSFSRDRSLDRDSHGRPESHSSARSDRDSREHDREASFERVDYDQRDQRDRREQRERVDRDPHDQERLSPNESAPIPTPRGEDQYKRSPSTPHQAQQSPNLSAVPVTSQPQPSQLPSPIKASPTLSASSIPQQAPQTSPPQQPSPPPANDGKPTSMKSVGFVQYKIPRE